MSFRWNWTKKNEIGILVILFLLAFILRLMTYNSIFVGNNVRFLEFDPFYHMRRAVSFAENFPYVWNFDSYIDYPYGNITGWPPLYDWTIALISNILGLGHPSRHLIETVGVFFPAVLGSLSVIVIYFVAKEIFDDDKEIGFIGGLLLAIIPAFMQVSFLGFVDHHVAEVLLSSTMFLFILKALNENRKQIILSRRDFIKLGKINVKEKGNVKENLNEKDKNKSLIFIVIAGLVLILAIFTWPGTPIFIGIVLMYIIAQTIIDKRFKHFTIIIGILFIAFIGLYALFPTTYDFLKGGIGFLLREGPVLQQIVETQPLFFTFQGNFTLDPSWFAFNTALYIAIFGLFILITRYYKKLAENRAITFFLVWTFIVMVLNLYQTRFIYLFAVNIVILCSYLIVSLMRQKKEYLKIIGMILLIIIIVPSLQTVNTMINHPLMLSNDWFTSLDWLKNNTPNPGNWDKPIKGEVPNYGVMEWWDYGNYILYLSQRPVIANNFQLGIEDSTKFFSSENVTEANNIMNERKARYVVVDYRLGLNPYISGNRVFLRGAWVSVALLLNKDLNYYLDSNNFPNDRYLNTMYAKLYLFDGKDLKNYKLVYKSPTKYPDIFNKPEEEIKIFEYSPD